MKVLNIDFFRFTASYPMDELLAILDTQALEDFALADLCIAPRSFIHTITECLLVPLSAVERRTEMLPMPPIADEPGSYSKIR
jgi:hypothetical protein